MKNAKRVVMVIMVLCLVLVGLLTTEKAYAKSDSDFVIENGVLTKYQGSGGDVVIPDGVTTIGIYAFNECSNLTSIIIPDSVTTIGEYAFGGCSSLIGITIPNSVTEIGADAFYDTPWLDKKRMERKDHFVIINDILIDGLMSLREITIPNGIIKINDSAFENCKGLTRVVIPNGVTQIGDSAFKNCTSLATVVIPDGLAEIGNNAFYGCVNLNNVAIPDSVTKIGDGAFDNTSNPTINIDTINSVELHSYDSEVIEGIHFNIDAYCNLNNSEKELYSADDAYKNLFFWSSSDETIVKTGMGKYPGEFLAMKPGNVTLTLIVGKISKSIKITVKDDPRTYYTVPEMKYIEKIKFIEKNGITINNKEDLFKHVYNCLSNGVYEIAIYQTDNFDIEKLLEDAFDLYDEYIFIYSKSDGKTESVYKDYDTGKIIKTDKNTPRYPSWQSEYITITNGKEAILYTLYNPDSKKIIKKMNEKRDLILKQIIKKGMSQTDKLKAIHDYIIKICDYDMEVFKAITIKGKKYYNKKNISANSRTAYGALVKNKANCDGYVKAFNLLARKAGIPTIKITGYAKDGLHAWNLVKQGNQFKYIDVTWDDPVNLSKANEKKPFAPIISKKPEYNYFLITPKQLKKDHSFYVKNSESLKNLTESWQIDFFNKYSDYTILQ